jgi:Protein of unknown function (DUF5818)
MKKTVGLFGVCVLGFSSSMLAGEWTGWLSDAKCAANGAKAAHKGCAVKCVEGGQPIVFVTDDKKVFKLDSPAKVKDLVGDKVVLTGDLDGETIKVAAAKKAE